MAEQERRPGALHTEQDSVGEERGLQREERDADHSGSGEQRDRQETLVRIALNCGRRGSIWVFMVLLKGP